MIFETWEEVMVGFIVAVGSVNWLVSALVTLVYLLYKPPSWCKAALPMGDTGIITGGGYLTTQYTWYSYYSAIVYVIVGSAGVAFLAFLIQDLLDADRLNPEKCVFNNNEITLRCCGRGSQSEKFCRSLK